MKGRTMINRIVYFFLLLIFSSACKMTADLPLADKNVPADYHSTVDTANIGTLKWHEFYQDTCLQNLISIALEKNYDVRVAMERIHMAEAQYNVAKNAFLPEVSAGVNYSLRKFGDYTMDGVGNDDTNKSESLPHDKLLPKPYPQYFAGLSFSWEADLWKKLSNKRKAALSRFMASQEMKHGVLTWLISEIADYYYELVGLDQEQKVLVTNLQLQEFGLELIKIQKAGGKVNQLAVDQFEAQLLNTKARLLKVEQKILVTEAVINKLLGRYPQPVTRQQLAYNKPLDHIVAGAPEELLMNRPDIREAELELTAANADVHAARAAFYPSLQLGGEAGFSAFDVSKWFLMPASAAYQLGAGLSAPIFQRKKIRSLYETANAKQRAALYEYQQTLLNAYHEVYTSLHNFYNLGKQVALKQQETEVLRQAYNNSNELFSVGYANYLEVITAQRRLLDVELELTDLTKAQLKNMALLYRALGGGWEDEEG